MHDILTWCVNHNPEKGVPHTIFTVIFCHYIFCRSVHVLAINRWLSRIALVLDCRLLYSTTTAAVKTHQNVFSSPLLTTKVAIAINIVLSNCVDPPEEKLLLKTITGLVLISNWWILVKRLLVACCLVDICRPFNCPYTINRSILKEIYATTDS